MEEERMRIRAALLAAGMLILAACGSSDSVGQAGAPTEPSSAESSPVARFAEQVDGKWRVEAVGTQNGVTWALAGKTNGEMVCVHTELDPPPADDYFVDPYAPYGSGPADVISETRIGEGGEDILNLFAGCAPAPPTLANYAYALTQPEVADPIAIFVEQGEGLAYRFVDGVSARDASHIIFTFDDGTTKEVMPIDGYFVSVFKPEQRLVQVDLVNDQITVECRVVGPDPPSADCRGPRTRAESTTP